MTQLLKDLFDLPERVSKSDFVLELASGVSDYQRTTDAYVATPGLVESFDSSLKLISSEVSAAVRATSWPC